MISFRQWKASSGETAKANGAIQWRFPLLRLDTQFKEFGQSVILLTPAEGKVCPPGITPKITEKKAMIDKINSVSTVIFAPLFSLAPCIIGV